MNSKHKECPYYSLATSKKTKFILPRHIRFVQRDKRLARFLQLFQTIARNARKYSKIVENHKRVNILKLLDKIIPLEYFGNNKYRKRFYKIVELVLTHSVHECIYTWQIVKDYKYRDILWLSNIYDENIKSSEKLCRLYLFEGHRWLLEKIIKPLISRFYATVKRGQTHELELVPKPVWTSFQQKVFNALKIMGHLLPCEIPTVHKPRGVLQIRPKSDYHDSADYRPILKLTPERIIGFKEQQKMKERYRKIGKLLCSVAEQMCLTKTTDLYNNWVTYVSSVKDEKLFAVKLDVKDAFGSIDIDTLCFILEIQFAEKRITENLKNALTQHIKNQYVIFGKTKTGSHQIWQWNHGLLQGDRFSSALCQVYMSYLDARYLKDLYKTTTFLHRTVDDYFFCSPCIEDVEQFICIMADLYKLNVNKTESNLSQYCHEEISYCGQRFVMNTKEVKGLYSFPKRCEIRHRFKLWNIKRPIYFKKNRQKTITEFLKKSMLFVYNNYHFKPMEINTVFNQEMTVMQNYFEAMIFLAFKFDTAFMAVYSGIIHFEPVSVILQNTIWEYAGRSMNKANKNKGQYSKGLLSYEAFLKIGYQAFLLVLKKRKLYQEHQVLDVLIKKMKKTDKISNVKEINFEHFRMMPKFFNNISIQRRLPHHKDFSKKDFSK